MAKNPSANYVCQECGTVHSKWSGKCEACGAWNTLVEEIARAVIPKGMSAKTGRKVEFAALNSSEKPQPRSLTGIAELDRVLGGGLVAGMAVLIGGDPGIGKSTLLLQAACRLSHLGEIAYITGEESLEQVRMRAHRLGLQSSPVSLAAATNIRDIIATLDAPDAPRVAIIDSIQTMYLDQIESAPGTVAQVRACSQELIRLAKKRGMALFLVGHVTKDGAIAGPRVLEHMVDTVLYFEGDRGHQFRILRAVKNRFGPTDEIGVFAMTDKGLEEVSNPSALFLAERRADVSGAVVFAGMEGTRPVLVEIQALVAQAAPGTPRRAVVGWDTARLAMVLAVLETRCGLPFGGHDVYLSVAGGLKITEPAADLAAAVALVSALMDKPVPQNVVTFGEIGLGGEVRAVGQMDSRLKEAAKLGFQRAVLPQRGGKKDEITAPKGLTLDLASLLGEALGKACDLNIAKRGKKLRKPEVEPELED